MKQSEHHIEEWQSAIQKAYDVFARYRRPYKLAASPVKAPDQILEILADLDFAPLSSLPAERLTAFARSALYTIGSEEDYKHFLPRILELMIPERGSFDLDPDMIADKLEYARFICWPAEEVSAIRDVFEALPFAPCDPSACAPSLATMLVANLIIGNDLESILPRLASPKDGEAVRRLAGLVSETVNLDENRGWLARRLADDVKAILRDWAKSDAVANALINGVDLVADDGVWEIEAAFMVLERS